MFKWINALGFSACFIFTNVVNADNHIETKKILKKAYAYMTTTNYKAVIKKQMEYKGKKIDYIISHYFDGKNNSIFKLQATDKKNLSYELFNTKGYFSICVRKDKEYKILASDQAPRGITTLRGELTFLRAIKDELNYNNITFSSKKINYNGIDCYEIIKKENKMPSPKVLAERDLWDYNPAIINKMKAQAEKHYPFIKKYIIGVKKPFIYSCEFFNVNGKKGRTYYWLDPDFNVKFKSKEFKLPPGQIIHPNKQNFKKIGKEMSVWRNK